MRFAGMVLMLLMCAGCQRSGPAVAPADTAPPAKAQAPETADALTDHVWMRTDSSGLPGVTRIFLSDGTLVMDSCWETFQLVTWRAESDSVVAWNESGIPVRAKILELSARSLVLRVSLEDGTQDERYAAAQVPYLCPDMKR